MRLKDNNNPFIHVNPPYQLMVIHSSKLVYPRELYQRGVERKRVALIAVHFNEYVANEPKVSFRNGQFIVTDGQHTIEGRILRNGGKDLPILCKVYTGTVSYTHLDVYKRQTLTIFRRCTCGKKATFRLKRSSPLQLSLIHISARATCKLFCAGTFRQAMWSFPAPRTRPTSTTTSMCSILR